MNRSDAINILAILLIGAVAVAGFVLDRLMYPPDDDQEDG